MTTRSTLTAAAMVLAALAFIRLGAFANSASAANAPTGSASCGGDNVYDATDLAVDIVGRNIILTTPQGQDEGFTVQDDVCWIAKDVATAGARWLTNAIPIDEAGGHQSRTMRTARTIAPPSGSPNLHPQRWTYTARVSRVAAGNVLVAEVTAASGGQTVRFQWSNFDN
jgi:hypothetical protein